MVGNETNKVHTDLEEALHNVIAQFSHAIAEEGEEKRRGTEEGKYY